MRRCCEQIELADSCTFQKTQENNKTEAPNVGPFNAWYNINIKRRGYRNEQNELLISFLATASRTLSMGAAFRI
jgi:hypothetical protein